MDKKKFQIPEKQFYPRPLWFWNDRPTKESLDLIMDGAESEAAYGGFGILAYNACQMDYMGEDYLAAYEHVIEKAKEKGLKLCLYDEWWFPSGGAGGLLKERFPESCAKRLDKFEYEAAGHVKIALPEGKLMAAVAVHMETGRILNLRGCVQDGALSWDAEGDGWKVMTFVCVLSDWDHVNYLDPEAVKKFIEVTHEAYFARFKEAFGDVIDSSFYDEPQMYAVGGRMWVDDFNERFLERYGVEPDTLYPALWYDIGENTASARCMFHSLRNDLYAEGFPKVLQEWCADYGISLTGHVDQEEMINPTGITGDLMKSFKYQDIPGFDEIMEPGRGGSIYKIVSSAANNWDKKLVMSECYGAMAEDTSIETMYDEAMEQYAKGMNLFVPHAVWLNPDPEKIIFHPELSWRNPRYAGTLKPFNEFCARMSSLLQEGRHVADIAVLYPIHGLNASYYFEWGDPYLGGPAPEYYDYQKIGDWLFGEVRRDFTFLHPEVLTEKCSVEGGELVLHNEINFERYKVLILPGTDVISLPALRMAKAFYDAGGTVIATSKLPAHAAEPGMDGEVLEILKAMFGEKWDGQENANGGKAWFIPEPNAELLEEALDKAEIDFDVYMKMDAEQSGLISYLHKVRDGRDLYYFINCGNERAKIQVSLKAAGVPERWDPHSGETEALAASEKDGRTCIELTLEVHRSAVVVL